MKGLMSLVLAWVVIGGTAFAIPPGFRATPFRPNVGPVPRGVPARFFAPGFNHRAANFNFAHAHGYNLNRNFGFAYGVPAAAFVPSYAPAVVAAPTVGCGAYFPQAAFAPAYDPAYAPGCSAYFGY